MEQSGCEERGRKVSDLKCEKIVLSVDESTQKPGTIETRKSLEASMFASQTPAKTNEPLHAKFRGELEILERWVFLGDAFLSTCKRSSLFSFFSFGLLILGMDFFLCLFRHKTIVELFDSMNCSLRLLVMRKKSPTFQNISAQVEVLTQRYQPLCLILFQFLF
jgi:chromatin licensing and DNA replication factor 1